MLMSVGCLSVLFDSDSNHDGRTWGCGMLMFMGRKVGVTFTVLRCGQLVYSEGGRLRLSSVSSGAQVIYCFVLFFVVFACFIWVDFLALIRGIFHAYFVLLCAIPISVVHGRRAFPLAIINAYNQYLIHTGKQNTETNCTCE